MRISDWSSDVCSSDLKHGTCTRDTPAQFFDRSRRLYARLRYPDMDALSRRKLTAGAFAEAMARANPGLKADMLRVTANRHGWQIGRASWRERVCQYG